MAYSALPHFLDFVQVRRAVRTDGENVDDEDSAPAAGVDLTIPLDRA
jgi:hypothetical protein